MPIRFTITDRHAPEIEALGQALARHNDAVVGPSGRCMLAVLAEAANEKMIAGLWGHTAWGWLYTRWLWVDPAFRSRGIATELLNRAETEAVMRGCTGAHIDTFSPQALNL
ncbi:MAG: GNAT family N-acetyltransferase, partial [Rhodobacteraceae bacterium]|nr:GNAT family N-acetyltransferase [Paracoccaceae bacterium]